MNLRKIKNKEAGILMIISILQVILLVNTIPSESFVINEANSFNNIPAVYNNDKKLIDFALNFLISFLTIKQISSVSAQNEVLRCCPRAQTANGIALDQDLTQTQIDNGECLVNALANSCSDSTLHNPQGGTCIVDDGISCVVSSQFACNEAQTAQPNANIDWVSQTPANAQINGQYVCRKGACVIGNNARFMTRAQCSIEGGQFLQSIDTEAATILLNQNLLQGACVLSGGACSFTTGSDCNTRQGDFYPGFLCTNSDLKEQFDIINQPTSNTIIVNDKVYWVDSQGQQANIYDSSKTFDIDPNYWQNVFPPDCSVYNSDRTINQNALKSCGNCNQFAGTLATTAAEAGITPDFGTNACKDLSCDESKLGIDFDGDGKTTTRKTNGDKWCFYEGIVGNVTTLANSNNQIGDFSSDTVGSEHWLFKCENGEISKDTIEHSTNRDKICQQTSTSASLVTNAAPYCLSQNPLIDQDGNDIQDTIDKCNENPHCAIKEVDIDKYFKFKVCVPKYPTGFPQADTPDETSPAETYCTIANVECTMLYQKKILESVTFQEEEEAWECIENCDCEKPEFAREMNNLCISLGDCGSYINYAGGGSDNIKIEGKEGKSGNKPEKIPVNYDFENYLSPNDYSEWDGKVITPPEAEETGGTPGTVEIGEQPEIEEGIVGQDVEEVLSKLLFLLGTGGIGIFVINSPTLKDISIEDMLNGVGIGGSLVWALSGVTFGGGATLPAGLTPNAYNTAFYAKLQGTEGTTIIGEGASPFAAAAVGAVLGAYAGASIAQQLDITGPAATILMVAGGTAGGTLTYAAYVTGANPWAVYFGWGALIIAGLIIISEAGKTEERKISFTCLPYEAPAGTTNADCGKCNENPLLECTQYRCESLGQTCQLLNGGLNGQPLTDEPICSSIVYEPNPPVITEGEVKTEGYDFDTNPKPNSEIIELSSGTPTECIPEYENVQFTLNTHEFAQCKWSYVTDDFELMTSLDGDAFQEVHNLDTGPLSWNLLDAFEITGDVVSGLQGDVEMHVKCQDVHENINPTSYVVNFCITQAPDEQVVDFNNVIARPANNAFVPFGTNSTRFEILIPEPAECKYDLNDVPYDSMANEMFCNTGPSPSELGKWSCATKPNEDFVLNNDIETIYIKCSDQPWLSLDSNLTNDDLRNTNEDSFVYTLKKTREQLKINTISIQIGDDQIPLNSFDFQEIRGGGSNFNVDLLASTSGGTENGRAECRYDFVESPLVYSGDLFFETGSTTHRQRNLNLQDGNYNISVTCNDDLDEDDIGNSATKYGTFNLFVDSQPPRIVRAFHEGGKLKLITNEEAKCAYGIQSNYCSEGTVDNGKSITTGFSNVHSTSWEPGKTYYIKCKDLYENENPGCARIIIPNLEVV